MNHFLLPFFSTRLWLVALLTLPALAQDPPPVPIEPSPANPPADLAPLPTPPDTLPDNATKGGPHSVQFDFRFQGNSADIFQTGTPVHVKTNEVVSRVVVIQSTATIDGEVEGQVVVIGGEAKINGRVGGDVVNVGAGIVLGPNAHVEGNAIGVLGGVQMGPHSVVGGNAVGVLGGVRKASGARVEGQTVNVALEEWIGPDGLGLPDWFKTTLTEIVVKLRPLSFRVGWVWVVAALFFALHALLLFAAPAMVRSVVTTLSERGATAFLLGLLALPLTALLSLLLAATGVGLLVVPFLWAALFCAGLVGKAGLLQFLGTALGRGAQREVPPLAALLIGSLLLSVLYLIPFFGLLFWMTFALWALGAALLALSIRFRKETPPAASRWNPPAPGPVSGTAPADTASTTASAITPSGTATMSMGLASGGAMDTTLSAVVPDAATPDPGAPDPAEPPLVTQPLLLPPPPPSSVPDALTLPRIGFQERALATLIDWVLLGMAIGWFNLDRLQPVLVLGYFVGLWVWRQTTVGGIILRLRVARLDGRPIDVATALVRAFGALFGGLALGLGYFWSGWDPEKQGWHDKIAGTVVVKVPKTQSLV